MRFKPIMRISGCLKQSIIISTFQHLDLMGSFEINIYKTKKIFFLLKTFDDLQWKKNFPVNSFLSTFHLIVNIYHERSLNLFAK